MITLNKNEKLTKEQAKNVTKLECRNLNYDSLPDMPKLTNLCLWNVPLKNFPDIPKLNFLFLKNVPLKILPDTLNLIYLNLVNVPLKKLPDMSKLNTLSLVNVPLKTLLDMSKLNILNLVNIPVKGLKKIKDYDRSGWEVIKVDNILKIGCQVHTINKWKCFSDVVIALMDFNALTFWKKNKQNLLNL